MYGLDMEQKPIHSNGSVQKCQNQKKHVMMVQIWRFCSQFSSFAIARCILNSCHKALNACAWVFGQQQNRNHNPRTVFTGLGHGWLFPFPKNEHTDDRKAFYNDWGDKRKIEIEAVSDTRKAFFKSVSSISKNVDMFITEEHCFESDNIVINEQINTLSKSLK